MKHMDWIGKTLGQLIDYMNVEHSHGIGFYNIEGSISLEEAIGLCLYDIKFRDKYYSKVITSISRNGDCSYTIHLKQKYNGGI